MDLFNALGDAPKPEEAEVKIDLSGLEKGAALEKLDTIVTYCKKSSSASLYVSFDPVKPGEGETLFQPIARYIAREKKNGAVQSAQPLMTPERGGLFVRFAI